jgi:hypothetical protein
MAEAPAPRRAPPPRTTTQSAPGAPRDWMPLAGAGVVALIAFAVYAITVEHTVPTGDSGELIAAAYVAGIAHPPGYPLYTMLGYIATHLPGGSAALRMNLMSGLFDAVAVGIVFLVVHRLIASAGGATRDRLPYVAAASASLALAFSSVFWAYSVVAEVFALNNLFAALLLLIGIEWARRPERMWLLYAFLFVFGLALTNQQTIVLFVPAFLVLAWRGWTLLPRSAGALRVGARDLAKAVGALIAGLLPLVYLPLAAAGDPAMNWGNPTTFGRFWTLLTRRNYGTTSLVVGGKPGSLWENTRLLFGTLTSGFVVVGALLALLGLWWAWNRRRAEGVALFSAFFFAGPVFQWYTNTDYPDELTKSIIARFYILPSIPTAIVAGLGAWWLLEKAAPVRLGRPGLVAAVVAGALLLVPVSAAAAHWSTQDLSGDHVAEDYGHDLLASLPPNALLLMRGDNNLDSVSYVQNVEHFRPDVIALDTELLKLPNYVDRTRRKHPDLLIPFTAFDGGIHTSLNTFVSDNIGQRPVYYVGSQVEKSFGKPFDQVIEGLSKQLLPKGTAPDVYSALARNASGYANLHYPIHEYPRSSWEGSYIAKNYAYTAFYVAYAIQTEGSADQVPLAERMYRTAIRLYPGLTQAYKDLGVILNDHGGDPKEIISVWQKYLELAPDDPQAHAIEQVLSRLVARQK